LYSFADDLPTCRITSSRTSGVLPYVVLKKLT